MVEFAEKWLNLDKISSPKNDSRNFLHHVNFFFVLPQKAKNVFASMFSREFAAF